MDEFYKFPRTKHLQGSIGTEQVKEMIWESPYGAQMI